MSDLRARPDIMAAVAAASGGTAYRLGETPPDLAALWKDRPQPTVEFQRKPLWDKPWWLGAVLAVLSLEWAIRRWRGMA
jgi:hypothetical protein